MKYLTLFIFIIYLITETSCHDNSKKGTLKNDSITKLTDTINSPKLPDINKNEKANVTVKLYFRGRDMSGYEGYENYKPETSERTEFRKKNKYTFCYDSEEFHNLQILGKGQNLYLEVKADKKTIFSKENFSVKEKITFTKKDFIVDMDAVYLIILRQKENILFQGKIDSQGCM